MRKDLMRTEYMLKKIKNPLMVEDDEKPGTRDVRKGEDKYYKIGKARGKVKKKYKTEFDAEGNIIGQEQIKYGRKGEYKYTKGWGSLSPTSNEA